jgi:hypothetical protein
MAILFSLLVVIILEQMVQLVLQSLHFLMVLVVVEVVVVHQVLVQVVLELVVVVEEGVLPLDLLLETVVMVVMDL